jgi:hypothetical protein
VEQIVHPTRVAGLNSTLRIVFFKLNYMPRDPIQVKVQAPNPQTFHPPNLITMKLNILLLSAAAMVNAAAANLMVELETIDTVNLGTAATYTILAKTGISTVPDSSITGNIAVSPIAATAITGFGLTLDSEGQFSTASQITGKAFGASYGGATAAALTVAVGDMDTAYTDAAGRPNTDAARINLKGGAIGGLTLTPGVYTFQMGISIGTGTDVTFDADGDPDAVFILQTTGVLSQAADTKVVLANGAQKNNIFWQVAGNAKVAAGAHMEGVLLVKTDVLFVTGSSLNGRVLAQTAVNLQMATITAENKVEQQQKEQDNCDGEDCA